MALDGGHHKRKWYDEPCTSEYAFFCEVLGESHNPHNLGSMVLCNLKSFGFSNRMQKTWVRSSDRGRMYRLRPRVLSRPETAFLVNRVRRHSQRANMTSTSSSADTIATLRHTSIASSVPSGQKQLVKLLSQDPELLTV